jgi:hypothetical protein
VAVASLSPCHIGPVAGHKAERQRYRSLTTGPLPRSVEGQASMPRLRLCSVTVWRDVGLAAECVNVVSDVAEYPKWVLNCVLAKGFGGTFDGRPLLAAQCRGSRRTSR